MGRLALWLLPGLPAVGIHKQRRCDGYDNAEGQAEELAETSHSTELSWKVHIANDRSAAGRPRNSARLSDCFR